MPRGRTKETGPMAVHEMMLTARYDDVANTLTVTGRAPGPPRPAAIPFEAWFPKSDIQVEFVVNINEKQVVGNPFAVYMVPDTYPIEYRLVEYVNGVWKLPGTVVAGP